MASCPFAVWRQYGIPQHLLSRFAGTISQSQIPWIKNWAIRYFLKRYPVKMEEAIETNPYAYPSFHEFFIRRLQPDLRPCDPSPQGVLSPCDATISQLGKIEKDVLLQAKGRNFTLDALLGNHPTGQSFLNGHYMTLYLAPPDYHRVHMPCAGTLQSLLYLPGKLFSVNPLTTCHVENLFARNERVVTFFKHPRSNFAIILVGAMLVGSIFTRWAGNLTPHRGKKILQVDYPITPDQHISLDKGEEMGYFSLGSTVILLFTSDVQWEENLTPGTRVVVGQRIGHFLP